mgnify:CR=1 FL=1
MNDRSKYFLCIFIRCIYEWCLYAQTMAQFLSLYFGSLFLNATFMAWKYDDMLVKMQWLFLEVRILWYVWEIMSL